MALKGKAPASALAGDLMPGPLLEAVFALMRLMRQSAGQTQTASLSPARYQVLHELLHEGPLRMGALAQRLGVVPRTMTDLVRALEADRSVTRCSDAKDGRAMVLTLTASGRVLLEEGRRQRLTDVGEIFTAALGVAEQEQLTMLLRKVVGHRERL